MYYLLEFETEGKNAFKEEYGALQSMFFEHDSAELLYKTKNESGVFNKHYEVKMIFSGDDDFFSDMKSFLTAAKSEVKMYKQIERLDYSFTTGTCIYDANKPFIDRLESYLEDKIKDESHFHWNLEPRSQWGHYVTGHIFGDIKSTLNARDYVRKNNNGLDIAWESLHFS